MKTKKTFSLLIAILFTLQIRAQVSDCQSTTIINSNNNSQIAKSELACITDNTNFNVNSNVNSNNWLCGQNLAKNHKVGDGVSPINKNVTYKTFSTTIFGGVKCVIIQNLGASQQATYATDATEISAGWYWQFNRKQGFKHDGITLTPNAWLTTIDEESDWNKANDPCSLLLGSGWRIPTKSEWTKADGGWSTYNDTYNSVLKLHASGYLHYTNGAVTTRGNFGYYWSSTQHKSAYGYRLYFDNITSFVFSSKKTSGYPLRCIIDN